LWPCIILALGLAWTPTAHASYTPTVVQPGVHWGMFWSGRISGPRNGFQEVQGFVRKALPWRGTLGRHGHWETAAWATLGTIRAFGDPGLMVSAGPLLYATHRRLFIELGVRPLLLTDTHLGSKNLGHSVEFLSHARAGLFLTRHLSVGYRAAHISNAGLADHNPGINLFTLQVTLYR